MVNLPPLTSRMQFVDPKTGLVTAQAVDFWQQLIGAISNNGSAESAGSGVTAVTLSGAITGEISGQTLTLNAPGVTYGGELVTSIVAGSGSTMALEFGVLTIEAAGGEGGTVALVSSQTVTGAASVQFTELAAGYDYFVVGQDIVFSTSAFLSVQFGSGSGPTWDTTSGNYHSSYYGGTTSANVAGTAMAMSLAVSTLSAQWLKFDITGGVENMAEHGIMGATSCNGNLFTGYHGPATPTAISAARINVSAGTISGTFYLYSVAR